MFVCLFGLCGVVVVVVVVVVVIIGVIVVGTTEENGNQYNTDRLPVLCAKQPREGRAFIVTVSASLK
jgi:hypothetical protein